MKYHYKTNELFLSDNLKKHPEKTSRSTTYYSPLQNYSKNQSNLPTAPLHETYKIVATTKKAKIITPLILNDYVRINLHLTNAKFVSKSVNLKFKTATFLIRSIEIDPKSTTAKKAKLSS